MTAATPTQQELCTVLLSICYSPTYGVPVLWFEAHKSSGTPLSLDEVLRSTLCNSTALSNVSTRTVEGTAPFLSQADHPATGRPSWFLHPCETEGMVREVLQAGQGGSSGSAEDGEGWEERWLQSWLMVVGGVVDLRE
ncbi:hypothetical protein JCM10450v2_004250 [Rhodotorula kratochvilovae]